ncbi:hypothetical protein [Paenibacillus sp. MMS20-IR301]|uniref:hypothetical protein n=1 Tax=Paenibacillus sp. MMS20-IR301 TaxID=2895946 RepID=UPI0028ECDAB3|nr:hypothetical protein [Paenibacillus sp. MMS20-IR301]WNS46392.1 hypothetical protein LOS79_14395 [Paenibacillus sp. MMS20-IR301]
MPLSFLGALAVLLYRHPVIAKFSNGVEEVALVLTVLGLQRTNTPPIAAERIFYSYKGNFADE